MTGTRDKMFVYKMLACLLMGMCTQQYVQIFFTKLDKF